MSFLPRAAEAQHSGVIQPTRTFVSGPAVRDTTARYFPQIDARYIERAEWPENPVPPIPIGPPDLATTVPLGTNLGFTRVAPRSQFPGINATGWVPPDPNLAVGATHVVQVVNSAVAFFQKSTGVKTFQQNMFGASGWFGSVGAGDFVFDPKCFYDKVSGRFFVLALELADPTVSKLLIAVSDDGDPNGTWFKYRIEARLTVGANNYWMDYPGFGSNKDAVVCCGNMFAMSGSTGFAGVQFISMKKAPMLTGAPTTVTSLVDPNSGSGQIANCVDPALDRVYAAAVTTTSSMRLYALTNVAVAPTLVFTSLGVPPFVPRNRNAFSTNGRTLDRIDSRLFQVAYRSGRLLMTHHVAVSGADDRSAVRWYDSNLQGWPVSGSPTLAQSGNVVGGAGQDLHMPGINMNAVGDVALTFTRSSMSITADVCVSSRKASDPPGSMSSPVMVATSANPNYGSPGGNRWGDYFSVMVDPNDNSTFWGTGMVGNAGGGWQTTVNSWTVSTAIGAGTAFDALTATMFIGSGSSGDAPSVRAIDGSTFDVLSTRVPNLGSVGGVECTYDTDQPAGTALAGLGLKIKANGSISITGMGWLWNWTTSQYEHLGSFRLQTTGGSPVILSARGNIGRFVGPGGAVQAVFRAVGSPRDVRTFTARADLVQVLMSFSATP